MTIDAGAAGATPPFQPQQPAEEPQPAQGPDAGNQPEQPEQPSLLERVAALEATVQTISGIVEHLDAALTDGAGQVGGLTEDVKQHVESAVAEVKRDLSNVKAAVGRAVGVHIA